MKEIGENVNKETGAILRNQHNLNLETHANDHDQNRNFVGFGGIRGAKLYSILAGIVLLAVGVVCGKNTSVFVNESVFVCACICTFILLFSLVHDVSLKNTTKYSY